MYTNYIEVTEFYGYYLVTKQRVITMIPRRKNKVIPPPKECPLSRCLSIIGGVWTADIIWYLSKNPRRFSELKDDIQGISPKMLTARLKKLEADRIIIRKVMPTSPPTVEYSLSDLGQELKPAIEAIAAVGSRLKKIKNP